MTSLDNTATDNRRVFISYSHEDKDFAEKLAHALHDAGEDVWWDQWEMMPGDSLVAKIFEEGLARAKAFIVVLSPESVRSKWVREELDVATIRKIEGVTRIIPVLRESVEIPISLRALLWLDMQQDFAGGVKRIINTIHGVTAKPSRKSINRIIEHLPSSVGEFSRVATATAIFILKSIDYGSGLQVAFSGPDLETGLQLDPSTINDAIAELEDAGLVRTLKTLGTAPFRFYQVEPTYVLFSEFAEVLPYNPNEDVKIVAAAVSSTKQIDGPTLAERTGLPAGRVNRAVAYLDDYGLAHVRKWLGTSPFTFGEVAATHRTRQFIE
jgi:DNA-binding MarR family transcriptional regulator